MLSEGVHTKGRGCKESVVEFCMAIKYVPDDINVPDAYLVRIANVS